MNNCIILGSGRSGTSMVAGMFRNSGAYMGNRPLPPTLSNERGYYEDEGINSLNNRLIADLLRWPFLDGQVRRRFSARAHTDQRCYWLAAPRGRRKIPLTADVAREMKKFSSQTPFCYKDPRFNITLHLWERFLPAETQYIVVFRDPRKTVDSILRDAHEAYDPPLEVPAEWAFLSWSRNYRYLLNKSSREENWLFLHYDQVVSLEASSAIEKFADSSLDFDQIDVRLSRAVNKSEDTSRRSRRCATVYQDLCDRAKQDLIKWSKQGNQVTNS